MTASTVNDTSAVKKHESSSIWGERGFFGTIWDDLKSFNRWEALWFLLFGAWAVIFSFVDFNAIRNPAAGFSVIAWKNYVTAGYPLWKRIFYLFSGIASFTGALNSVLAAKGKQSNFFWGLLNVTFYGAFAFAYGYAGDAQLNYFFFLPMQLVGMWAWSRKSLNDEDKMVIIRFMDLKLWLLSLLVLGVVWVAAFFEIPVFYKALTGDPYWFEDELTPHLLDALSVGFAVVLQMCQIFRYFEMWIFFMGYCVVNLAMFGGVAFGVENLSVNALTMYSFWFGNCVWGMWMWWYKCDWEGTAYFGITQPPREPPQLQGGNDEKPALISSSVAVCGHSESTDATTSVKHAGNEEDLELGVECKEMQ